MNPLFLWRLGGLVLVIGAVIGGYRFWEHKIRADERSIVEARYEKVIVAQKEEAKQKLAEETSRVAALQTQLSLTLAAQEAKDATHKKAIAELNTSLRRAADVNGHRLRDPNQPGCGPGGGSPPSGTGTDTRDSHEDPAETGGLFSAEATRLLIELTEEADTINVAYASCRADSLSLREKLQR